MAPGLVGSDRLGGPAPVFPFCQRVQPSRVCTHSRWSSEVRGAAGSGGRGREGKCEEERKTQRSQRESGGPRGEGRERGARRGICRMQGTKFAFIPGSSYSFITHVTGSLHPSPALWYLYSFSILPTDSWSVTLICLLWCPGACALQLL